MATCWWIWPRAVGVFQDEIGHALLPGLHQFRAFGQLELEEFAVQRRVDLLLVEA